VHSHPPFQSSHPLASSRRAISTALVSCRARQFEKSQAVLFADQENQRVPLKNEIFSFIDKDFDIIAKKYKI
jgi:hypothetical protein